VHACWRYSWKCLESFHMIQLGSCASIYRPAERFIQNDVHARFIKKLLHVDKNVRWCPCPNSSLHVADKTSKPMLLEQCQWTPVETDSALCCRWSLWQRGVSSAAAVSVHVLRVLHLWLRTTHLDPPDDIGTGLSGRNTPPPPVAGLSPASKL